MGRTSVVIRPKERLTTNPPWIILRMAERRLKRPRDPAQLAKLIVDIATGEVEDRVDDGRDAGAAALGRKGSKARASRLTPERRREIAKKAASIRWRGES
jgi:hypothetical protein